VEEEAVIALPTGATSKVAQEFRKTKTGRDRQRCARGSEEKKGRMGLYSMLRKGRKGQCTGKIIIGGDIRGLKKESILTV